MKKSYLILCVALFSYSLFSLQTLHLCVKQLFLHKSYNTSLFAIHIAKYVVNAST